MKRILIVFLAALLVFSSAFALTSSGYPIYDGTDAVPNSFCGSFGTDRLKLEFDPAPEFSMCANGYVQACFFAMNATGDSYVEIYLVFPQNVQPGNVVSPSYAAQSGMDECGISFYEVLASTEKAYIAMQQDAAAYPQNSNYVIRITAVEETETTFTMRGSVSGMLAEIQDLAPTGAMIAITNAAFDFTMPKPADWQSAAPEATPEPLQPWATFEVIEPEVSAEPVAPEATPQPTPEPEASQSTPEPEASQPTPEPETPQPTLEPFAPEATEEPTPEPNMPIIFPMFTLPADYARI